MIVYYRMCGIPSTNPSPIYQEDKFKLNEICLRSFVRAFKEVNPSMVFLNDFCDGRYSEMIDRIVPFDKEIQSSEIGINETCLKQYQMAKETNEDLILFQECDYYYRPNTGRTVLSGVKDLGLISPYDNLNFYLDSSIHSSSIQVKLVDNQHWRTVERTTMTFALKSQVLKDNLDIFMKYGYLDDNLWHELRARGHQMWTPLPSLSTHMVKDFMAPGVNWKELWEE